MTSQYSDSSENFTSVINKAPELPFCSICVTIQLDWRYRTEEPIRLAIEIIHLIRYCDINAIFYYIQLKMLFHINNIGNSNDWTTFALLLLPVNSNGQRCHHCKKLYPLFTRSAKDNSTLIIVNLMMRYP